MLNIYQKHVFFLIYIYHLNLSIICFLSRAHQPTKILPEALNVLIIIKIGQSKSLSQILILPFLKCSASMKYLLTISMQRRRRCFKRKYQVDQRKKIYSQIYLILMELRPRSCISKRIAQLFKIVISNPFHSAPSCFFYYYYYVIYPPHNMKTNEYTLTT